MQGKCFNPCTISQASMLNTIVLCIGAGPSLTMSGRAKAKVKQSEEKNSNYRKKCSDKPQCQVDRDNTGYFSALKNLVKGPSLQLGSDSREGSCYIFVTHHHSFVLFARNPPPLRQKQNQQETTRNFLHPLASLSEPNRPGGEGGESNQPISCFTSSMCHPRALYMSALLSQLSIEKGVPHRVLGGGTITGSTYSVPGSVPTPYMSQAITFMISCLDQKCRKDLDPVVLPNFQGVQ